ncbi:MAG: hypothetical protein A2Z97_13020 [Bdellovibrionales bacterium GWB1_52_6]|nr:MAG: hypothetical protein A2Z97_13020 [Bdellovibrionales bacterium GWB1_52_6]OFZ05754.1 MAG: hypothetical protein A2X97_03575 [Bdellovibrionales bacterium GWA1_52_35]HCM40305.1 hypothetical protein [Bdellovibrionales bacterium]
MTIFEIKREFSILGLLFTGVVVGLGTLYAFERGGQDFEVFYHAWRLVLNGHGSEIYRVSPDRFLYAPGFASLLSPLALLPRSIALGVWCLAKAAALGLIIRFFTGRLYKDPLIATGIGGWAVLLLTRPILIDFQYGQVNLFILGAAVWALLRHFRGGTSKESLSRERLWDRLSWALLAVAAVAKVFPLPLLLVPWITRAHLPVQRLRNERVGVLVGLVLVLCLPFLSYGVSEGVELYRGWYEALLMKGFPLESHNQSFAAFIHHYLTGAGTAVLSEGGAVLPFGFDLFSFGTVRVLAFVWTLLSGAGILIWLFWGNRRRAPIEWIAVAIGILILPSHLVWKPYFVMGLPLAVLCTQRWLVLGQKTGIMLYLTFFAVINLTGFDFVGHEMGPRLEAASLFLWAHLAMIAAVLLNSRNSKTS